MSVHWSNPEAESKTWKGDTTCPWPFLLLPSDYSLFRWQNLFISIRALLIYAKNSKTTVNRSFSIYFHLYWIKFTVGFRDITPISCIQEKHQQTICTHTGTAMFANPTLPPSKSPPVLENRVPAKTAHNNTDGLISWMLQLLQLKTSNH